MAEIVTGPNPAFVAQQQQNQSDLVGNFARLQQLKSLIQNAPVQQQALQQQVQEGQLNIQKEQLALQDQQKMGKVMQDWGTPAASSTPSADPAAQKSTPDYDSLLNLARKSGVSYGTYQGLTKYVQDMKEKAATIAKDDAQTGASNANALKTKNGLVIDALSGITGLPDDQIAQGLQSATQNLSSKGLIDPSEVQQAQQLLQSGDPAAIRKALNIHIAGLGGFSKLIDDAQKKTDLEQKQGKSDPNSIFYAPSEQSMAMGTAPGAARIQQGQVKQAAAKAGAEAAVKQPFEMALARQRQALSQGDPKAAAQLLIDGDATLSELKARGSTPQFIAQTLYSAHQMSGGKYNAQEAESQFNVAKSPANLAFFGSAKSLVDPGGTLDQLSEIGKKIPQGQIPALNSIADWEKAATGSGPVAEYAAKALGVADDYAKVMGGGQGSDTSRGQALKIIAASASPEQRAGALNGIRGSVDSQINSRIGKNPVMQRMYGSVAPQQQPKASPASIPPAVLAGAKEGQYIHGPNGEVFKKVNGQAVQQ
jgi:hypothetical protein